MAQIKPGVSQSETTNEEKVSSIKKLWSYVQGLMPKKDESESDDQSQARKTMVMPKVTVPRPNIKILIVSLFFVVIAVLAFSPFAVRLLTANTASQPLMWYGINDVVINFSPPPPTWGYMVGNLGQFLPWILWMLNVPLLLWQLSKERKLADEMNDWWLVLLAAILFWFVRNNPLPFGAIGGKFIAWWGGTNINIWQPEETLPFMAIVCAGMGLYASLRGRRDLTPVSMICVVIAIIWKAYDTSSDDSWSKVFLFSGVLFGVLEIIREPASKKQADRAGVFGMVITMVAIFAVVRSVIYNLIKMNTTMIAVPPSWYIELGRALYANASVVAIIGAAMTAWMLRFQSGKLLFGTVSRMAKDTAEYSRLIPNASAIKFWDSTILSHYAILVVWLFMGAL